MLGKTFGLIHKGLSEIKGSLIMVDNVENVGYDELVKIRAPDGIDRMGRVLEVGRGKFWDRDNNIQPILPGNGAAAPR